MIDSLNEKQGLKIDRWGGIEQEMAKSVAQGRALFQVDCIHFVIPSMPAPFFFAPHYSQSMYSLFLSDDSLARSTIFPQIRFFPRPQCRTPASLMQVDDSR